MGDVKIDDQLENIFLETDFIRYDKTKNKINTKGVTKALVDDEYEFISSDVLLDKNFKKLMSNYNSTIKDEDSNFYKLSNFIYFYETKFLKGNKISVTSNYQKNKSDKYYFENAFINLSEKSFISKDTKIDIHKNIFDAEREPSQNNILFEGENDPRWAIIVFITTCKNTFINNSDLIIS